MKSLGQSDWTTRTFIRPALILVTVLTSYSAVAQSKAPLVDLDFVLKLVQDPAKKVSSVEGVLSQLPLSYRGSYAILHSSRSVQEASYLNPRVIFTGSREVPVGGEELVMSFNGGGTQFGGNSLELMQWKPAEARFELYEISFRAGATKVDGPNPAKCMTCHSRGTHDVYPLWDTYFLWSGAYGSNDGHIKTGTTEDKYFRQFVSGHSKHPRYKYLVGLEKVNYHKAKQDYMDVLEDARLRVPGYFIFPATGDGLQKLNVRYASQFGALIAKRMQSSPLYAQTKNLLSCGLAGDYNLFNLRDADEGFYEDAQSLLNQRLDLVAQRTAKYSEFKASELRQNNPDSGERTEQEQLTGIAWISQIMLGQPSTTWSTAIGDQSLNLSIPHGTSFMDGLKQQLGTDPNATGIDCDAEVAKALVAHPGAHSYGPPREDIFDFEQQKIAVPQVALVCASCHASDPTRHFQFQNPAQLKPILTDDFLSEVQTRITDGAHGFLPSMPYGQDLLSPVNQQRLMQYLKQVKSMTP